MILEIEVISINPPELTLRGRGALIVAPQRRKRNYNDNVAAVASSAAETGRLFRTPFAAKVVCFVSGPDTNIYACDTSEYECRVCG